MEAAYITQTGPPENIIYGELPDPRPGPNQCLVKVGAVSVNPIDTYIRGGLVKAQLPSPFIIGCDLAGTVVETGPNVIRFKPGDRVWGSNQGMKGRQGTFAEYAAVDEQWLYPTPSNIPDTQAAAIALVAITAHLGLTEHARLQPGETLFVNGGTGGVGAMVVQMAAKALGARVITTAGTPEKVELCRKYGAAVAINYKTENVQECVKAAAPQGLNVWWETLREPNFDLTIPLLALGGRMIVMAGRDAHPPFPVGPFYIKDCSIHGFAMFNATAARQQKSAAEINKYLSDGQLLGHANAPLPLSKAAEAHRMQEEKTLHSSATLFGKIILQP